MDELQSSNVELAARRTYHLHAQAAGIEIQTLPDEAIDECWPGKPKGLKQVLCKHGLIDPNDLSKYSKDRKKDPISGKIDLSTSFVHIMEQQPDFQKELSALKYLCFLLGVGSDHSPKFHCEFAGDGIEYAWAIGKGEYRWHPLSAKKGMENFSGLVRECFG